MNSKQNEKQKEPADRKKQVTKRSALDWIFIECDVKDGFSDMLRALIGGSKERNITGFIAITPDKKCFQFLEGAKASMQNLLKILTASFPQQELKLLSSGVVAKRKFTDLQTLEVEFETLVSVMRSIPELDAMFNIK